MSASSAAAAAAHYDAQAFAHSASRTTTPARSSPSATFTRSATRETAEQIQGEGLSWIIANCSTRAELDAVVIATPDHWHGKMAMDAMDKGKDVYLEKPMVHTNEEARQLVDTVKETKRVLQVGSQTTSADIWWKAKKAIADGMIGQMIDEPGLLPPQRAEGEWNWPIDTERRPGRQGRRLHRLEHVAGHPVQAGPQARLGRRPLLPLPQVLGLFAAASRATSSIT